MIKRILVALDTNTDVSVTTGYAADIARRYGAEIVGLAVVDKGQIDAASRGGAVGSMYYAEKLRENLTEETRARAGELIKEFHASLANSGVEHLDAVEEGVPFRRIVEDMKYHDLLVVGRNPHFFYGHPEEKSRPLARVVKETSAPSVVVGNEHRSVQRVLLAYDASTASARTMQFFAHLKPFGSDLEVEALHVHDGDETESRLILRLLASYMEKHGFRMRETSMRGSGAADQISDYATETNADIVVAGAHSVSMLRKLAFGSTTEKLLTECPTPLFLHH